MLPPLRTHHHQCYSVTLFTLLKPISSRDRSSRDETVGIAIDMNPAIESDSDPNWVLIKAAGNGQGRILIPPAPSFSACHI